MYGVVKWYNKDKGYGFIISDDGGEDYFVHHTQIQESKFLCERQRVEFEAGQGEKGIKATKVKILPQVLRTTKLES